MLSLNIERKTLLNNYYRKVIYTDLKQQLVLMSVMSDEEIPLEKHNATQFFRIEAGRGVAEIGKKRVALKDGVVLIVPKNTYHRIRVTSYKSP